MSIAQKEKQIVAEFASAEEWFDKYEKIIQAGAQAEPFPAAHKTPENEVGGCQSTVWIHMEEHGGKMKIWGDSDTLITRGIIALLLHVLNNEPRAEIAAAPLPFLDTIGLRSHLSPSRANGLLSILEKIRTGCAGNDLKSIH